MPLNTSHGVIIGNFKKDLKIESKNLNNKNKNHSNKQKNMI